MTILDQVRTALDNLAGVGEAADIAEKLKAEGITGTKATAPACLVANYIHHAVPEAEGMRVNVLPEANGMAGHVIIEPTPSVYSRLPLPFAVNELARQFDAGRFPELEEAKAR